MAERTVEIRDGRVRRPAQPWTPTVHAALSYLRSTGCTEVPVPLALQDGYEEVSLLAGRAGPDSWPYQSSDRGLRSAGQLLRRVHDASVDWLPPADAVWAVQPVVPWEVLCHGDPGPWNMVWVDGQAVGLFDWDFCHPGPRLDDVAYALEWLAPCCDDHEAIRWRGFSQAPDRGRRIAIFCEAYGISSDGVVDAVISAQRRTAERVRVLAASGVEPQATWVAEGHLERLAERVAWTRSHRHLLQ